MWIFFNKYYGTMGSMVVNLQMQNCISRRRVVGTENPRTLEFKRAMEPMLKDTQ